MYYARVSDSWISAPVSVPSARLRLVCFPHAGGGASSFVPWARLLAPEGIEVVALRLPGREARLRETPPEDLSTLVAGIDDALTPSTTPVAWWGHSSGARIAFELARRRHANGGPLPGHLIVSGAPAPDVRRTTPTLHRIVDDGTFLQAVAHAYGGVPEAVLQNAELRALVAPALRADLRLHERYVFVEGEPLPIPITAWGGTDDPSVSEDWVRRWARHTSRTFEWAMMPGDHFFVYGLSARNELRLALRRTLLGPGS